MMNLDHDDDIRGLEDLKMQLPDLDIIPENIIKEIMMSSPNILDQIVDSCASGEGMEDLDSLATSELLFDDLLNFEVSPTECLDINRLTFTKSDEEHSHILENKTTEDEEKFLEHRNENPEEKVSVIKMESPVKQAPAVQRSKSLTPIKLKISKKENGTMECELFSKEMAKNHKANISEKSKQGALSKSGCEMKNINGNRTKDTHKNTDTKMHSHVDDSKENRTIKASNVSEKLSEKEERIKAKFQGRNTKKPGIIVIPAMPNQNMKKTKKTKKTVVEENPFVKLVNADHDYCMNPSKQSLSSDHKSVKPRAEINKAAKTELLTNQTSTKKNKSKVESQSTKPSLNLVDKEAKPLISEHGRKFKTNGYNGSCNMVSVLKKSKDKESHNTLLQKPLPTSVPCQQPKSSTLSQVTNKSCETNNKTTTSPLGLLLQQFEKVQETKPTENLKPINDLEPIEDPKPVKDSKPVTEMKTEEIKDSKPVKSKTLSLESYYKRKAFNPSTNIKKTKSIDIYYLSTSTHDPNFIEVGYQAHILPLDVVDKIRAPKQKCDVGCQTDITLESYLRNPNSKSATFYSESEPEFKLIKITSDKNEPTALTNESHLNNEKKEMSPVNKETVYKYRNDRDQQERRQQEVICIDLEDDASNELLSNKKEEELSTTVFAGVKRKDCSKTIESNEQKNKAERFDPKENSDKILDSDLNGNSRKRRRYSSNDNDNSCENSRTSSRNSNRSSRYHSRSSNDSSDESDYDRSRSSSRTGREQGYKKRKISESTDSRCSSRNSNRSSSSMIYSESSGRSNSDSRSSSYSPYSPYSDRPSYSHSSYKSEHKRHYAGKNDGRERRDYYKRSTNSYDKSYEKREDEEMLAIAERRVVYVGHLESTATKSLLRQKFQKFGTILNITIRYRQNGNSYGFVTFKNSKDAYRAIDEGNHDPRFPVYDLSFGGRREFCKVQYADLDAKNVSLEEGEIRRDDASDDFSTLLRKYEEAKQRSQNLYKR